MSTWRFVLVAAAAALAVPAVAAAKGPSEATITGPGISVVTPLTINGNSEGDTSTHLGLLVSESGFFPQAFGQSPDPLLRSRPAGSLGARYSVTYTVPGLSTDKLRQDLYPYAVEGPASYMQPGQKLWDQTTHGGWYRGTAELRRMLVRAGLPKTAPATTRSRAASQTKKVTIAVGAGTGIVLAAGAALLLRRKR
jgi:hypothetical protein